MNRTFVAINGGTVEEHVGRTFAEAIPTAAEATRRAIEATLGSGVPQVDIEVDKPGRDGTPGRQYLASYYRIDGPDGVLGVGIVAQDVTEQIRVRGEIERQRNLYETLLRTQSEAGQGMALLDGDAVAYVNDAASEIVGYSLAELGSLVTYLDIFTPEERDRVSVWLAGVVMQDDDAAATIETALHHKAGHTVDVELSAQPVTDRESGLAGMASVVVVGRDISDRKQAERERAELLALEQSARRRLEDSHRRLSVLARAGAILERSLDLRETLPQVADLVVAELADSCSIDVRATGQRVEQVRREGNGSADGEDTRLLRLPLLAGDTVVGSLSVGRRTLDDQDDQLLRELARRVALAVANAHLYAERDHVAVTLQRSLLPRRFPTSRATSSARRSARPAPATRSAATSTTRSRSPPASGGSSSATCAARGRMPRRSPRSPGTASARSPPTRRSRARCSPS